MATDQRCKRSDGRGWRCRLAVAEGKTYCHAHIQQALLRQKRQPVPDHLKLHRTPKLDPESNNDAPVRRAKRKTMDVPSKRAKRVAPADSSSSSHHNAASKAGVPIPALIKSLPGIKENVKAVAKEKINKRKIIKQKKNIKTKIVRKCHWCRLTTFCVLIKCLTCKKNFFCEECINERFYCKKTVERECPVCQEECPCRACTRGKPKQVKAKESVIYDVDEDVIIRAPEKEITASSRENMSKSEKSQQLHMIQELLPVMSKMNLEKIMELDNEAQNKGICHDGLRVQIAGYTEKKECSFCKACIPDVHRSCAYCSFVLCLVCSYDIRDGYLHSMIEKLKDTKMIRSKSSKKKSWRLYSDGRISCPPKNLGGCERGFLHLTTFYPFCLTKDLEESARQILRNFQLKKPNRLSDSSPCMLCDENGEAGVYFSTKLELKNNQLEHFMKHWGKGIPIVIREVFQAQADLDWDFGFILCQYLKKSAESRNNTNRRSEMNTHDWCEVEFKRKQIFSSGVTHENVWNESLKFKLRFSCNFFQDHFPDHHNAVIQSLPLQEYMNPFTGFMNLGAYSPHQVRNPNLGSYVSISYGGLDNPLDADLLLNLRLHAYDEVNVLVYATARPVRERILNVVKMLMNKYNSQDHLKSSKRISNRNKLEWMFASTSKVDDEGHNDVDVDLTSSRLKDTISHGRIQ